MSDQAGPDVTLATLHEDLRDLGSGIRTDLRELTALIASGLRALPPDFPGEAIRLLREINRLNEERFAQPDVALREQALETHTILRALADGQRQLVEGVRQLVEGVRQLAEGVRQIAEEQRQLVFGQRGLSDDIRALIARIDALIRGRGDGGPAQEPQ
jgi:X-X-X-Leu-X-X-Gly heptad repeat protein